MRFGTHRQFGKRSSRERNRRSDAELQTQRRGSGLVGAWAALRQSISEKLRMLSRRLGSAFFLASWFIPGIFFIMIGLCAAFAPELVLGAVAAFFVFLGFACFALALKFLEFKHRVEKMARSFEARIMVQGVPVGKVADPEERGTEKGVDVAKKILYH